MVIAGLGFLAGILWLDLIFDVQILRHAQSGTKAHEDALALMSTYYRHATGGARPMDLLIAVMMLVTLAAIIKELIGGGDWVTWSTLIAAGGPIVLAGTHTVPSAVKLGATPREASVERRRLARTILREHVMALAGIVTALTLQLAFAS